MLEAREDRVTRKGLKYVFFSQKLKQVSSVMFLKSFNLGTNMPISILKIRIHNYLNIELLTSLPKTPLEFFKEIHMFNILF